VILKEARERNGLGKTGLNSWIAYLCWKDKGNLGSPFVMGIEECKIFVNEEFLVGAAQHVASISSLAFVHTARRAYRLLAGVRK